MKNKKFLKTAKEVINLEIKALEKLKKNSKLRGASLAKIQKTDAYKELEKAVKEYAGS